MGSKGSNTTTTNQSQTYSPAGAGYIQNALNQGQNAAQLPFNIPQAPVAGFSQDQQNAFNTVNNAQGMAQPYYNQAQNLFNQSAQGPNVSQFFNPYASAVTSQLNNVFGQQNVQNTGSLTQAAGGVGADRIAVGQSQLANQQGLAAGQTLASLYQPSLQAAQQQQSLQQSAAYGMGSLGSQAENTALSGAQAQLGTGGLQQQLSQAQLNAPYQQQLAQAAFPYQQAQFNAGITGALAPGLGGTTTGYGQTTSPAPSLLSQILGGGAAATGILGGTGAFGGSGYLTGSNGIFGGSGKGTSANPSAAGTPGSPYYGPVNNGGYASGGAAYDSGGGVSEMMQRMAMYNQLNGGASPSGFNAGSVPNSAPINADAQSIIPTGQTPSIQAHMPSLNLTPPQQSQSNSGGISSMIGPAMQIAKMFAKDGGAIHDGTKEFNPYFAQSGAVPDPGDDPSPATFDERFPYQTATPEGMDAWRSGTDADIGAGQGANTPTMQSLAYTGPDSTKAFPPPPGAHGKSMATPNIDGAAAGADAATSPAAQPPPDQAGNPYSAPTSGSNDAGQSFIKSPWAALTAAGLGIMGGTSPFAGVNIGQGAMQGLKVLEQQRTEGQKDETIKQAADRLKQEAKFHEDQFSRATPYQQFEMNKPFPMGQRIDPLTGQSVTTFGVRQPDGSIKPVDPTAAAANPSAAATDEGTLPTNAKAAQGFLIPGQNVPDNVDPSVLANVDPGLAGMVRAIDEGRESLSSVPQKNRYMVNRLLAQYDPQFNGSLWNVRNKQQTDLTSNGNAGKMLLATNQLLPHLMTASDKTMQMANSNYPEANTIRNWWLTATGDPRVKEFQSVREVAAMDAARLLRGTGQMAEKDIEEWRRNIGESGSPKQLQGVIKQLADDLVGARVESIKGLYRMNMRQEPPEFLWPQSKAALAKIKENYAAVNAPPPATGGAAAAPARPAGPAAPPAAGGASAAPAAPQLTPQQKEAGLAAARSALANGRDRGAVIKRLQENGIDPSGL